MSAGRIESLRIRGFRSLADVDLSGLGNASVMIGANGSGKSNFVRLFEMMCWMLRSPRSLNEFVQRHGGADDQLYGGSTVTSRIAVEIAVRTDQGLYDYRFALANAHPDRLVFAEEAVRDRAQAAPANGGWYPLAERHPEATVVHAAQVDAIPPTERNAARAVVRTLRSCTAYQFHDTSDDSRFMKHWDAEDNDRLLAHGGNLAAVLHRLEREDPRRLEWISGHIRRVLPIFDRFQIAERYGKVLLRWKALGSDKTFGPHLTSDGSLRSFALVTLLNLPGEMLPDVLLLDEPELGLHPATVSLVGGMIKALATDRQVIVATQSPLLVDSFDCGEIVVADFEGGKTSLRRLDSEQYQRWLDDGFTSGELWQKNLLGGNP